MIVKTCQDMSSPLFVDWQSKTRRTIMPARAQDLTQTRTSMWQAIAFLMFVSCFCLLLAHPSYAQTVRPPENAVTNAMPDAGKRETRPASVPSKVTTENAEFWRDVRSGVQGNVSIPDKKAGVLVQAAGEEWRHTKASSVPRFGAYILLGMLAALALFYGLRGRIRVAGGLTGQTIERFSDVERMAHWLMAVSFVILGLTGLNIVYGKSILMPILGKDAFASLAMLGKWLHNYVAFAFMVGLAASFVFWVRHNIPSRIDIEWLAQGGGLFSKDKHPPSRKFNAGQKILFWLIMLSGLSISLSGLALLFPFQFSMFSKTFAFLNLFGFGLPTDLKAVEEMQYAATWHSIVGIVMVAVIFAHIYIGSIGMEGAFDAMGSGQVDVNWAREHHNLWAEEVISGKTQDVAQVKENSSQSSSSQPATS